MKTPKAIRIISTLNKTEIELLSKFIRSPFFITREDIISLCFYCIKTINEKDIIDYYETAKYSEILTKGDYTRKQIIRLFTELFQILEKFILQICIIKNKQTESIEILDWYEQKNLIQLFNQKETELKKIFNKKTVNPKMTLLNQLRFEEVKQTFVSKNVNKRTNILNHQNISNKLDEFYLESKMSELCLMINREKIIEDKYNKTLINELMTFAINNNFLNNPYIECHYNAINMLNNPGREEFYSAFQIVVKNYSLTLDKISLRKFYVFIENECKNVFKNPKSYYKELFNLYKMQIESDIIYYQGKMLSNVLKNIIIVAIKNQNIQWGNKFLDEIKDKIIPKENKNSIYSYCKAELAFSEKEYNKALNYLMKFQDKDLFLKLAVKRLYIKIWFETQEWDSLLSHINSLRVYLHREKLITVKRKDQEKNFINAVQSLYNFIIKPEGLIAQLEKIESKNIVEGTWVIQQIKTLTNEN